MKFFVTDSRGNKSATLTLTLIPFVLVNLKFLIGGMTLPFVGDQSVISVIEYSTALGIILAPFLVREGIDKNNVAKVKVAEVTAAAKVESAEVAADAKVEAAKEERMP